MKKIIFIQRNSKAGISIIKVSQPIIDSISNKNVYEVPAHGASIRGILTNLKYIFSKRKTKGIFHITGDIHYGLLALINKKTVLTIHDTVTLDFFRENKIKKMIKKLLWFTIPLKTATKVVCISHVTKGYVERYTKRKDIEVIHNCVDSSITVHPPVNNEIFNFLLIGTNPNKNIERTIHAVSGLKCKITIIGKLSKDQMDLLKEQKVNYENKFNLSDKEIYEEYYKSDAVLFCSLFEGFGMPILEANKAGRPIICSDIPVLKEVAGDSAYFVDPLSVNSIREGCVKVMEHESLRNTLVKNGLENVKQFNKEIILNKWHSLYSKI